MDPLMPKPIRSFVAIAPFSIIMLLGWTALGSIQLLNSSLVYVGSKNELPEDVYGLGFAGVWLALLLPFILLCCLSRYLAGQRQSRYWSVLLGLYAICSIGGFWLDHIIWPQLIR
jgi:hypothetical protein